MTKLKVASLARELPYWDLRGGVMILDDGRLEVGLELEAPGRLARTEVALARLHDDLRDVLRAHVPRLARARLIVAVRPMREDELPQTTARQSAPSFAAEFALARSEHLRNLRRDGDVRAWRVLLTLAVRPPTRFSKDAPPTWSELQGALRFALDAADRLAGALTSAGYRARRLEDADVVAVCDAYLNDDSPLPLAGTIRERLARTSVNNENPRFVRVGRRFTAAVSLASSPTRSTTGMLDDVLARLGKTRLWLIVDFVHLDPVDVERRLETTKNRLYAQAGSGEKEAPNVKAQARLRDVGDTIEHLTRSGDHLYRVGLTVVLASEDRAELNAAIDAATTALAGVPGSGVARHAFQSVFAWLAALPFSGRALPFTFEATATTAADFLPTLAPWRGDAAPTWPLRTRFDTLASVDLLGGETAANHFAVFAPTGYGKTFAVMSLLAAHLHAHDPFVTVIDRKQDFRFLVEQLGGATVSFAPGGSVTLNPLDLPKGETRPDPVKEAFLLALVRFFVPAGQDAREAGEEKALILDAMLQTYRRVAREGRSPLLSEFAATLTAMDMTSEGAPLSREQVALSKSLALRLRPYLGDSAWGRVLDRATNVDTTARVLYYDLSGIGDADAEVRRVALHLVQDRVWQAARTLPRDVPKIAFVDEFGSQIQTPEDLAFVSTTLRLARSHHLAFGLATQTLEDMRRVSGLEEAIYTYLLGRLEGGEDVLRTVLKLPESAARDVTGLRRTKDWVEWLLIRRTDAGEKIGEIVKVEESRRAYWYLTSAPVEAARRDAALKRHGTLSGAVTALLQEES